MSVDIAAVQDWPHVGLHAAFTVDLTTEPLALGGDEYELIAVATQQWNRLDEVVANTALRVRRGTLVPAIGELWEDAMAPAYADLELRHLLVLNPILAELKMLFRQTGRPFAVRWLELVPITHAEAEAYAADPAAFMKTIQDTGPLMADWTRSSLV